jgi:signal transduction histidine kinase
VSRFGTDMLGATPEYGHTWHAWQMCRPDSKDEAGQEELPLARACAGAVIRNEEWLLRPVDGALIPISCDAGPIKDASGNVVGGTMVWYDVTLFKDAQRLRELYLAAVSHELRTPLNAIYAWSCTLRRTSDPALVERGLTSIERNVQTQARLVDDLLDAARIAAGKLSLNLAPECLVRIARGAVDAVLPIAEAAHVVMELTVDEEAMPVVADDVRLRQAISNLLTNAVKFSRPGGLVAVRLTKRGDVGELEVTDCGIGIDAAHLDRVFEQFWQSIEAGRSSGLGLGLSIARYIALGHGGDLAASSEGAGRGATFTLKIPLSRLN